MITECAFSCRLLTPHLSVVASRCIYGVWIDNCSMFFELGLWIVMRMMLMVMGWGNLFYLTVQMCETSWGVSCRLQPTSTQEESLWYTFPTHNQFSAHPIKQKALLPSLF